MKILSTKKIKELDEFTIAHEPISSLDLMERASNLFTQWFIGRFDKSKKIKIFCGPGNNGGDGLAIARILLEKFYKIEVFIFSTKSTSEDFQKNKLRLEKLLNPVLINSSKDIPYSSKDEIIIDAIFGSGLNRPAEDLFAEAISAINKGKSTIISVDIASGLYCDEHTPESNIIKPAYTISFQLPKLAFLLPENEKFVGDWQIINIGLNNDFIKQAKTQYFYTTKDDLYEWVKKRDKFSHKGTYGRALIIAGSYGMIGAAILVAKACLRTGTGLCRTYIPECGYEIMQSALPENMVMTDPDFKSITDIPDIHSYNAIAVGPGLGEKEETKKALSKLFKETKLPLVIDASALNMIASDKTLFNIIPPNSILTPHPKEFERLAGPSLNDFERLNMLRALSDKIKCFIVLKGAYTVVATPKGTLHFNSTGNPGMATAGSGDVLTGIITSLLAQGYEPYKAAILAVYLHGYAGDSAALRLSKSSLMASDIIEGIHSFYKNFSE
jgi:ADP-dependent NAD(P)H-hydrate dehydratase / NAD(P)H-hydrate epimerase